MTDLLPQAPDSAPDGAPAKAPSSLELNGINVIAESERKGSPKSLFWPWFAANVSVLAISYGSFVLGFTVSLWQAVVLAIIGVTLSFLLCGVVSLAGKRGSAPTMVLSRSAFGVRGNGLPSAVSWLLCVGWETALTALATLATSTVFTRLGWGGGTGTKIVAFLVVVVLVVGGGILGFDVIMRMQTAITVATGILTVGYLILTVPKINWGTVAHLPNGSTAGFIGALVLLMTGFGFSWANTAADYSRYLPRSARSGAVVFWPTFGGSIAPVVLVIFGVLLAGSDKKLSDAIGSDPIGALTSQLPTWYLVPFALVAVLGLIGGAVLDIYSSGLALLTLGLKVPRYVAGSIDGVLMILGSIYVVFVATDFVGPFQGFLITLGVPIAAWAGVFVADLALRRGPYADAELYDPRGRYGSVRPLPVVLVLIGTFLGWGLVTSTYPGFGWQGYLLGPIGGRDGGWAFANLGVLVAVALGFLGWFIGGRGVVRRQEAVPVEPAATT